MAQLPQALAQWMVTMSSRVYVRKSHLPESLQLINKTMKVGSSSSCLGRFDSSPEPNHLLQEAFLESPSTNPAQWPLL